MKRSGIYYNGIIGSLDQGCIFSGAISRDYADCEVFGLVVTPRCDIAQNKVNIVHYVPIVHYEDWIKRFLSFDYQRVELTKQRAAIESMLQKHKLPSHIISPVYRLNREDLRKTTPKMTDSEFEQLETFWNLHNIDFCKEHIKQWKNMDDRLYNLIDGKSERFILLESWNTQEQYYVICLTDILRLTTQTANDLVQGIRVRDIDFSTNDLYALDDQLATYSIHAKLSSPYMEYITQRVSNAFFRIGIEDWNDRKQLCSTLKNLI